MKFAKKDVDGVVNSLEGDLVTIRLIPLLLTADMKAHGELGLVNVSGYNGCRRCTVKAEYLSHHCRYGSFQYRYEHPSSSRTAEQNRLDGKDIDSESNPRQGTGVTGESQLYTLYDLCGFDPVKDAVIDVMHALALNLISTELKKRILAPLNENTGVNPTDRDPSIGGVLVISELKPVLKLLKWTSELKEGRVPREQSVGFWKAEEFVKFALVAPFVLREIVPKSVYECFVLLADIRNMVYSNSLRIQGWERTHVELLNNLLWKHAIAYENLYGLECCSENLEYSLHMPEDISRHSSLDNYWCYMFERLVSFHKQQANNRKNICKTLADRVHHPPVALC